MFLKMFKADGMFEEIIMKNKNELKPRRLVPKS
jgi:hypothetical protein